MQYVENTRHSVLKELSTHTGISKCFGHAMGYNMGELKSFKDVPTNHADMYKCVQTPPPCSSMVYCEFRDLPTSWHMRDHPCLLVTTSRPL